MNATVAEMLHAAVWYQEDARFLHREIERHRDRPGAQWLVVRMQEAARESAALARINLDMAAGRGLA